jgi:lysophospholipase L1-like esterase
MSYAGKFFTVAWRALAAAIVAAALAACGEKVPPLAAVGAGETILAFGDSLTYGTGAAEPESYPVVLAQITGRTVVRDGVPGEVTAQGLARIDASLEEHRPKLVILCLGGNDMLRKVPDAEIVSNLRQMVQKIRGSGAAVVLVGVPRPQLLGAPPEFYGEIAQAAGIPYERRALKEILYDRELKSDPIHPNAKGYRKLAEAIAALLKKSGAVQ